MTGRERVYNPGVRSPYHFLTSCILLLALALGACAPAPAAPTAAGPTATPHLLDALLGAATATTVAERATATASAAPTLTPPPTAGEPSPTPVESGPRPVQAIILFIGDGMGEYHRLGAQWLASGALAPLAMDAMPARGYATTAAADREITDSGAAATALATGRKTNYASLGVDVNNVPVTTILEHAQEAGWAAGLVSTVRLADATPGAFAAHVPSRAMFLEVARQMLGHGIEVLLGGGEDDFTLGTSNGCGSQPGHRGDANLVQNAIEAGATYICTAEMLAGLDLSATPRLLGLFADDDMPFPANPTLAEMTRAAISVLSQNPNGFFLMVEGGQIDHFSHDNDALGALQATLELNAAVAQAQVYALGQPNTLIIVTADHETGGMTLNLDGALSGIGQDGPYTMPDGTVFYVNWATGGHTAVHVPVTAQGPYSQLLTGEYPNTHIFEVMYAALMGD